jgi:hypothetical protein
VGTGAVQRGSRDLTPAPEKQEMLTLGLSVYSQPGTVHHPLLQPVIAFLLVTALPPCGFLRAFSQDSS